MDTWARRCGRTREKRQNRRRADGPSLEALEERCLLSTGFTQINLDSDIPGLARVTDPNLVNPWGIAFSPTGAFWFGDNGTSVSDVVGGDGQLLPVVVAVPGANGSAGKPTGTVYNGGSGFQVAADGVSGPAHFLFATADGTISGWNPQVDAAHALLTVDNSAQGASYMGLAMADGTDGQSYLYAADFGRGGIDVFDQNFDSVAATGSFTDPNLPSGFAPFNVQNVNGQLFVAYAMKNAAGNDDAPGAGNGFIDVFSPSGNLLERLASGGTLNSPWGMAVAPQSFGPLSGALLVGNNGDGHISAYNLDSGAYLGQLTDNAGTPIAIEGLWGLTAGNDHLAGNSQTLFFAAGILHEQHGLFGAIQNSQAGQLSTTGTLPYDPNSDGDDYPLPPAHGPALGNDVGQPTPTPVLLSANNSSFALAPTLSISSETSENRAFFAFTPVRSSAVAEGTQNLPGLDVAIGSIPLPEGLTAFSLTAPMTVISSDRSADRISERLDSSTADSFTPVSLMFLGPYPSTDFAEPENSFLLVSTNLSRSSTLGDSVPELEQTLQLADRHNNMNKGEVLSSKTPSFPEATASAQIVDLPTTPFHLYFIRGFFLMVAACLPWNYFGASQGRSTNSFSLQGRKEEMK